MDEPTIWQNLVLLVETVLALLAQLATLGFHWLLWIFSAAVCLWAINWKKARHMLAVGGWAPAVLIILLIALVWSRLVPGPGPVSGLPNFWWQAGLRRQPGRPRHVLRLAANRLSLDAARNQPRPAGTRPRARSWASLIRFTFSPRIAPCERLAASGEAVSASQTPSPNTPAIRPRPRPPARNRPAAGEPFAASRSALSRALLRG